MTVQLSLETRIRAAGSVHLDAAAARELAQDEETDVRMVLAANETLSDAAAIARLQRDVAWQVREAVARNTEADLDVLAEDAAWQVRSSVAANRWCSPRQLLGLLQDEDETVRKLARRNPACPEPEGHVSLAAE